MSAQSVPQPSLPKRKSIKHPCRKDRFRATVIQVGETPKLQIDGGGEHYFAYRSVKKRPGELRQTLVVGDVVDCRLTKTVPAKAVSIKIVLKMPQPPAFYTHDPYRADLQEALPEPPQPVLEESLLAALGDMTGIESHVDGYLESVMGDKTKTKDASCYAVFTDNLPDDVLLLGPAEVLDPVYQEKLAHTEWHGPESVAFEPAVY